MKFLSAIAIIVSLSCHKLKDIHTIITEKSNIQNQAEEGELICILYIEKVPEFVGGNAEMYKYISKNLQTDAIESKLSGKIFVRFDVLENGTVDNVEIIKGAEKSPILRKKLIEVFQNMPKWKPGEDANGKAVKMKMTCPIFLEFE